MPIENGHLCRNEPVRSPALHWDSVVPFRPAVELDFAW